LDARTAGSSFPTEAFGFTVHSVFSRALNLRPAGGGALLSLVADAMKAHPRAAVAESQFDRWGLVPGCRGRFDGRTLCFDGGPAVVLPESRTPPAAEAVRTAPSGLHRRRTLWTAAALVLKASEERGGPVLPGFESRLAAGAAVLETAVAQRSVPLALEAWSGLLGLGPGLTPAADDFLCGSWAGLASLAAQDAGLSAFLARFRDEFAVSGLLAATNDISAAFVAEAVAGRFGAALVAFAEAALGLTGGLDEAVADLAALGASSGLDAARGFLFAFRQELGG
jgi:hypothetical protein